ncbi:helix-turn-helix transcriptional regulator [Microbacterium sp. A93]
MTALLASLTQSSGSSPAREAAMRKVLRAMPQPFRESAQRIVSATMRGAAWGIADLAEIPDAVEALQRAIAEDRRITVTYAGRLGDSTSELVPLIIGSRGERWYLIAAPTLDGQDTADPVRVRTYRVDRILAVEVLRARGVAPDEFDRTRVWAQMVARVEDKRGAARAVVRVATSSAAAMQDKFGTLCRVVDSDVVIDGEISVDRAPGDGTVRLEVRAQNIGALAEQLAGWSNVAEVIEPPEVRSALRELGAVITATYADDSGEREQQSDEVD